MADVWLCDTLAVLSQGPVNDLGSAGTSWAQEDMRQEDQDSLLCPCDTLCVRALCLGEKSMLWDLLSITGIAATSPPSHLLRSSLSASICLVTTHLGQHCQPDLQQPPSFNLCHCPLACSFQRSRLGGKRKPNTKAISETKV